MKPLLLALLAGCSAPVAPAHPVDPQAPLSNAADVSMVAIPAGKYIAGSTIEERNTAYDDYQATANTDNARTHRWFDKEPDRKVKTLDAFRIDLMPVTQAAYAEFVSAGRAVAPTIDEPTWKAQGFSQDYATQVARFLWRDGRPPGGHEDHPVVLVTHDEATRYCQWRNKRRLPTADEYEKAARGDNGYAYPWGNTFEASKLNSAVGGPGDTTPVGTFNDGASQYGVLGLAGDVFHWTSTPGEPGKMMVKGSAWDDYGGVGRGASLHGRKRDIRHVIVGFRCAVDGGQ